MFSYLTLFCIVNGLFILSLVILMRNHAKKVNRYIGQLDQLCTSLSMKKRG